MVRLKDVAARAGVSLMTVSKVLRDAPDVSQLTKIRIRRLAEEMGYVPDALARGLRTRHSKLFGLIIPSFTDHLLSQAVLAIEDQAHQLGYDLLMAQTHESTAREEICVRRLLSRRVDGLFICPVYRLSPTAPIYEELKTSGTPTVLLGPCAPFCGSFVSIETDDALASCEMTRHLLKLGHEKISFFAGPPAAPWAQERFEGYRRALREADLRWEDNLIFTAGGSIEEGRKAGQQFLNESTEATAIQTASDLVAIGVAAVLGKHGVQIPQDLSLAGFGNHLATEHLRVPLTTVQQPTYALGQAAAEHMLRLLRGEAVEARRLPAELVIRQSTSAPKRRSRQCGVVSLSELTPSLAHGDDLQ